MKRKLKRWVEVVFQILGIIGFILVASDSDSTYHFIIVHIIGLSIMIISTLILYKYTDMFDKE